MIEPEDVARYRRELAAMLRAACDDPKAMAQVAELLTAAQAGLPVVARRLITQGYSWSDVGAELGVSRQAAWRRFGAAGR